MKALDMIIKESTKKRKKTTKQHWKMYLTTTRYFVRHKKEASVILDYLDSFVEASEDTKRIAKELDELEEAPIIFYAYARYFAGEVSYKTLQEKIMPLIEIKGITIDKDGLIDSSGLEIKEDIDKLKREIFKLTTKRIHIEEKITKKWSLVTQKESELEHYKMLAANKEADTLPELQAKMLDIATKVEQTRREIEELEKARDELASKISFRKEIVNTLKRS